MFIAYRTTDQFHASEPHTVTTSHWGVIEQDMLSPWFYLQVVRKHGRNAFRSMVMLPHAHDLKNFIDQQSNFFWVEQVQVVTPPSVNGRATWLMQPLAELSLIYNQSAAELDCFCTVVNGEVFTLYNSEFPEQFQIVGTWYSATNKISE